MLLNMEAGLSTILDMHNMAELGSLCGTLGLAAEAQEGSFSEKKRAVLSAIEGEAKKFKSAERAHAEVLKIVWDGILHEVGAGAEPRHRCRCRLRRHPSSSVRPLLSDERIDAPPPPPPW